MAPPKLSLRKGSLRTGGDPISLKNGYRRGLHKHKHGSGSSLRLSFICAFCIIFTIPLYSLLRFANNAEIRDNSGFSAAPRTESLSQQGPPPSSQQQSPPKRKATSVRRGRKKSTEGVPPLQQQSTPKFRSKARKQGKKQAVGEALPLQQQSPPKFRPRATKQGNKGSVEEELPSQHRPMGPPTPFIRYLDKLAQIPAAQLWDVLGMDKSDYGENPFLLRELEGGTCPRSTIDETPVWLPDRPANSEAIAGKYRGVQESLKRGKSAKQMRMEQYDADNEVVLWYEQ